MLFKILLEVVANILEAPEENEKAETTNPPGDATKTEPKSEKSESSVNGTLGAASEESSVNGPKPPDSEYSIFLRGLLERPGFFRCK